MLRVLRSWRWLWIGGLVSLLLAGCTDPTGGCTVSIGNLGAPEGNPEAPETVVQEDSFQVSGSPRLVVETENGAITVRSSGGAGEVRVTAAIKDPDKVEYQTGQNGDTVSVSADFSSGIINAQVDVEVAVPEKAQLELETSNGRITLSNIDGSVSAKTSNGGITFAGSLEPESQNSLRTSNGDVDVTLVNTSGVKLDAETRNGKISSELPITITGRSNDDRSNDDQLTGDIGDGSSSLRIRTSNGDITIK
jgi:DUF4097 and DUF4098 domain-containing protein YvlB